jgi:hypothetical protein
MDNIIFAIIIKKSIYDLFTIATTIRIIIKVVFFESM